ncbi:Smg-4/UPF3 family-domain-containing protein [Durotheca rogersii]|uniref:Smg-4/UPF3 family-domain-containing protein n=1 Tax=Durotheca rogersii TaxID=419775 RepID=UPI002220F295|nr:Smg-4/UPF3 family-domain-containing protein [Durotheca rogersii]KAI5863574.1 Smg-4/UPF3 family-domain-containing protein [Durotheca rogersii]
MATPATSRKPNGASGVLSASTAHASNDAPKAPKTREPLKGRKVVIRRLPPGLSEAEFWAILGDEWKSRNGKVDWTRFHDGQISQDPAYPSTPARCYLQVQRAEDTPLVADIVQRSTWEDEKRSFNDSALVGPPYVEVSIYQKVPTKKKRADPKQGTIDQDSDFMAFLDSLTQDPAPKETEGNQVSEDAGKVDAKVNTTPLVEFLKEKKASKGKEVASAKSGKHSRHESQNVKPKGNQEDSKKKSKESKADKHEKAAGKEKEKVKEPVKILIKKPAPQVAVEAAKPASGAGTSAGAGASAATQPAANKPTDEAPSKIRRAGIAAAAKILQRDLGLSPGSAHRRARQDAAKADQAVKTDTSKEKDSKDSTPSAPAASSQPSPVPPPPASTAPKASAAEGSRRPRGAKSAKPNASNDSAKGKGSEGASNPPKQTQITTPVILKRKDDVPQAVSASTAPVSTAASSSTPAPPTGPKATSSKATSSKQGSSSQKKASTATPVTAGMVRAFIKHANASQGITEAVLKQTMEAYGSVTFVEIDKRKGFAYLDFADHESLVRAIAASPVTVAQGAVQVLERKEPKKQASAPVPAPAPAPAQVQVQAASEKTASAGKSTNDTAGDRPKRGGRGRGRKGAANANNGNGPIEETASSATPTDSKAAAGS